MVARKRIEENSPWYFQPQGFCEELGLPYRRKHEQILASGDGHQNDWCLLGRQITRHVPPAAGSRSSVSAHGGVAEENLPEGETSS